MYTCRSFGYGIYISSNETRTQDVYMLDYLFYCILAFITVISRSDIHQSVVVGRLRFHYIFISKPDTGLPWEDIANVILFIPMGVLIWYCCWAGFIGMDVSL